MLDPTKPLTADLLGGLYPAAQGIGNYFLNNVVDGGVVMLRNEECIQVINLINQVEGRIAELQKAGGL